MGLDAQAARSAIEAADIRVLLMVLYQTTADAHWLDYAPKRDVKLVADEDAGLPEEAQRDIREAAFSLLIQQSKGSPTIADPGDALMARMMSVCLGEDVPAEYAPLMREELGFCSRDVEWRRRPDNYRDPLVLIVGAGASGIALGARLERLGLRYMILERHREVGGVWHENRYPGAGVDTPNHAYSFSFGAPYAWSHYFSARDEIYDYLRARATDFGVRPQILFEMEVTSARWDEDALLWRVSVKSADGVQTELTAAVLVSAIGQFGVPSIPKIPGLSDFPGPVFHSAAWQDGLDVAGKKVSVVGTGASAMQIVPSIVNRAKSLTIFQRTPQWARPIARYHDSIGPSQWLFDNVPLYVAWFRFTMWWRYGDGLLPSLRKDSQWPEAEKSINRKNDRHRSEMVRHIQDKLGERMDLVAACTPSYPPFAKRILLDNGWYDALKRTDVQLVPQRVIALTKQGPRTADQREWQADVVVFATGFEIAPMASRLNVKGVGGVDLAEVWADENPHAYLGITVPRFPNFYIMQGPNTGLGHGGSAIFQSESQARYITSMLVWMLENSAARLEVRQGALDEFVQRVDEEHGKLIWTHPGVSTYYRNKAGRVVSVMPFRLVDYWAMTHEPNLTDYYAS